MSQRISFLSNFSSLLHETMMFITNSIMFDKWFEWPKTFRHKSCGEGGCNICKAHILLTGVQDRASKESFAKKYSKLMNFLGKHMESKYINKKGHQFITGEKGQVKAFTFPPIVGNINPLKVPSKDTNSQVMDENLTSEKGKEALISNLVSVYIKNKAKIKIGSAGVIQKRMSINISKIMSAMEST